MNPMAAMTSLGVVSSKPETAQKATLLFTDPKTGAKVDEITAQFNPEKFSIKKSVKWSDAKLIDKDSKIEYRGEEPQTLDFTLLFDTIYQEEVKVVDMFKLSTKKEVKDVRDITDKIRKMMVPVDPKKSNTPPLCTFSWGGKLSFKGAVIKVDEDFLYFSTDGTPVRSEVKITLKQVTQDGGYKKQNPTSVGAVRKTHMIQQGDRLDLIAYQEFGDSNKWHEIARFNNLQDPLDLKPGQILGIPVDV